MPPLEVVTVVAESVAGYRLYGPGTDLAGSKTWSRVKAQLTPA